MQVLQFSQHTASEWIQIAQQKLLHDNLIDWGKAFWQFVNDWFDESEHIIVHTSGSTGKPKVIKVSKEMMRISAKKTIHFLNLQSNHTALLCLSANYIAGKMMIVRAIIADMQLYVIEPSSHPLCNFPYPIDFSAMVPMQVFEQLKEKDSLNQVKKILIGGGAVSAKMQEALQTTTCACFESYGMTETVSHIALRKINGSEVQTGFSCMENVSVALDERDCLTIISPDLLAEPLQTNDCAKIFSNGEFRILGRIDNVINSGGIKVQPEEIERKIAPFFMKAYAVSSIPDEKLGEKLVLVAEETISPELLQTINQTLPAYNKLHQAIYLPLLPLNVNGKLDRISIKKSMIN